MDVDGTVEEDLGKSRDGSRTDDEVVQRWVALCKSDLSLMNELWSSQPEQVGWTLSLLHKVNKPMLVHTNALSASRVLAEAKFVTCYAVTQ